VGKKQVSKSKPTGKGQSLKTIKVRGREPFPKQETGGNTGESERAKTEPSPYAGTLHRYTQLTSEMAVEAQAGNYVRE